MYRSMWVLLILFIGGCSYPSMHSKVMSSIEKQDLKQLTRSLEEPIDLNFYYHDGFTPLTYAVKLSCSQCVEVLLQYNLDVNKPQKGGLTALGWAVFNDDIALVKVLVNVGADKKAKYDTRMSAEELSIKYQRKEIALYLEGIKY